MKSEYKEKLDKVIELFLAYGPDKKGFDFSDEENNRRWDMFDELLESGDAEVLRGLMGLLTMKVGCVAGALDESFPQEIFNYYTHEQIMDAIFDKFDAIYDNDERPDGEIRTAYVLEDICSDLWSSDWKGREDGRGFQRFREMFNKIRPRNAERFLNEMEKYKIAEDKARIQTLREDMAKW
jgi:hypothetical protein